jgi:hypothetical protein
MASYSTVNNLTATGSGQSTALTLDRQVTVNVVTTTASGTGVKMPILITAGTTITIINNGANTLTVYPQGTNTINGATTASIPTLGTLILVTPDGANWLTAAGVGTGSTPVSGNLNPAITDTYTLGSPSLEWKSAQIQTVNTGTGGVSINGGAAVTLDDTGSVATTWAGPWTALNNPSVPITWAVHGKIVTISIKPISASVAGGAAAIITVATGGVLPANIRPSTGGSTWSVPASVISNAVYATGALMVFGGGTSSISATADLSLGAGSQFSAAGGASGTPTVISGSWCIGP